MEDGSVVDLGCAGALMYHLTLRDIAMRGPPEFAECDNGHKCVFFEVLVHVFTTVERRESVGEFLAGFEDTDK